MKEQTLPNLASSNNLVDEFLSSGSIHYVYQPIIDVTHSVVTEYESLVRHVRGARSNVITILPMSPMHRFRLDVYGISRCAEMMANDSTDNRYVINMDSETLLSPNFANEVKRVLPEHMARRISLEITSRNSINIDNEEVIYNLESLSEYGIQFGVDGIGIQSCNLPLITLKEITFIKLDAWITSQIENPRISGFATSMAQFCEKSGLRLLAKDVESEKQSKILLECGIRYQQGRLFGEPFDIGASQPNH